MATRAPPPENPPPYAALPLRYVRASFRPAVLLIALFSSIWGLAVAVNYIKDWQDHNVSGSLKTIFLVMAVLYFIGATCELFGLVAVYLQRPRLVQIYFILTVVIVFVASGAELLRLIVHFTLKSSIINACIADELDDSNPGEPVTSDQASSMCNSSWTSGIWWDVILLIATICVSLLFTSITGSYLHQLRNPSTLRTQRAQFAPSSAYNYPLAPYPHAGPGGQGFMPPPVYAPPPGPPPPGYEGGGGGFGDDKKDEANPFEDPSSRGYPYSPPPPSSGARAPLAPSESQEEVTLEPRTATHASV